MAEEADKSIENGLTATSAPLTDRTAEASQDVKPSGAQPAKSTEQAASDIEPGLASPSGPEKELAEAPSISAEHIEKDKTDQVPPPVADATQDNHTAVQADDGPAEPLASLAPSVPQADAIVSDSENKSTEKVEPAAVEPAKVTEDKLAKQSTEQPDPADTVSHEVPTASSDPPVNGAATKDVEMKEAPTEATQLGSDSSPVTGDKRKAEDAVEVDANTSNKKAITEAALAAPTTNGNGTPPAKKVGRPKKEKRAPAPATAGRALRKTRSQGPVED